MNTFQQSLKKYINIYIGQETYFASDMRNLEFYKKYPSNSDREAVHQKLSVMDDADFTKLQIQDAMTEHILKLNVDPRLAKGDLSVVDEIAHITISGNTFYLLHFASAYCNLHRPDVFPIYSDQHVEFYKRYIIENKLALNPDALNQYGVFTKALDDLITRLGIKGKLNYLQIRKFAWVYAEKVLEEARQ